MITNDRPDKIEIAPSQTVPSDCLEPDGSCVTMAAIPVGERLQKLRIISEAGIKIACEGERTCGLHNVAKCLLRGVIPGNPGPDRERADRAAATLGMFESGIPGEQLWQAPSSTASIYAAQ